MGEYLERIKMMMPLTHYLIKTPYIYFNAFANTADPDQAALKSCLIRVYSVCLWKYDISDPTLVDLRSNLFFLYMYVPT